MSVWERATRIATLAVVLLVFSLAGCGGGGGDGSRGAVVTVGTSADVTERDGAVSLREALQLANGELVTTDLDAKELDNVRRAPGAASADTIVFDPVAFPNGQPATITLTANLPPLSGGNDTVDGSSAGVIIDGNGEVQELTCLTITSSGNSLKGLQVQNCRTAILIDRGAEANTIGGTTPGERNVVSGNPGVGIEIRSVGNIVIGNYIGTDATGTVAMPNDLEGVWIGPGGRDNRIGGSTAKERNVISGNKLFGVSITGEATGNTVQGNYIGLNAAGTAGIRNNFGVLLGQGAQNNIVGGSAPGERNVVSGNGAGILIRRANTSNNLVQGNIIGPDPDAIEMIGNAYGVWLVDGAQHNVVGGTLAGEGNLIAGNDSAVVAEGLDTIGNTIRGNSIYENLTRAIATVEGGNGELAQPLLEGANPVRGTACPNCTVDIYSDEGNEGRTYDGSTLADADGRFVFDGETAGPNITTTATDADGNTSAFSEPVRGSRP